MYIEKTTYTLETSEGHSVGVVLVERIERRTNENRGIIESGYVGNSKVISGLVFPYAFLRSAAVEVTKIPCF